MGLAAGQKPDTEAVTMLFMSQAPTLQYLNLRHDALPPDYLGALASLQSLTFVGVRRIDSCAECAPEFSSNVELSSALDRAAGLTHGSAESFE